MEKKGQVNMEIAGKLMVAVLILAVLGISSLLIYSVMSSESVVPPKTISNNHFNNNTVTLNSSSTATPATCLGLRSPSLTNIVVTNQTAGVVISSGNFTVSGCAFSNTTVFGGQVVNISADYSYVVSSDAVNIAGNSSSGLVAFFVNLPTIFVILGITVVIGVIGLIIVVVRKLQNRENVASV